MKTCTRCGADKPNSEFHRDQSRPDGLCSCCKECARVRAREHYIQNKDKHRENVRAWRASHKERTREIAQVGYHRNRAAVLDRFHAYRASNIEKRRASNRVQKEITAGRLQRGACGVCGAPNADAHHADYTKPLDIQWLCRSCHKKHHAEVRHAVAS